MPVIVEAPDGVEVEFPDGMTEEEMHSELARHLSQTPTTPRPPRVERGPSISVGERPSLLQRFRQTGIAKELGLESEGARLLRESQIGVAKPDISSAGGEGFIPALSHPMVPLDVLKGTIDPEAPASEKIPRAIWNATVGLAEFAESPLGVATAGAGALAQIPKAVLTAREGMAAADVANAARNLQTINAAQRVGAAGYAAQMGATVPEAAREQGTLSVEPGRLPEAGVGLASSILLPALPALHATAKGPNASRITEAAKVHGDLREQPGQGQGQVPAEVGSEGVRARPKAAAEEGQQGVLLSPEDQAHLDAERGTVSAPVEVLESLPGDQPFAKKLATIDRKTGKILLNRELFSEWLRDIPTERRPEAVRSLLAEEQIHLHVDDTSALDYWNNLTAAEKAIQRRRYTGKWRGDSSVTDTNYGHEAVRFRMQQLARMSPTEIVELSGRERWGIQALTALESGIRTAREALGTKASGTQLAIIDRMQANLDAAKLAVGESAPGAQDRKERFMPVLETASGQHYPGATHTDALKRATQDMKDGKISPDEFMNVLEASDNDAQHKFRAADGTILTRDQLAERTGGLRQSEQLRDAGLIESPESSPAALLRGRTATREEQAAAYREFATRGHAPSRGDEMTKFFERTPEQRAREKALEKELSDEDLSAPAAFNRKAQESADETVKGLRAQAAEYRKQGDESSAAELEQMAKTVETKMQEQSFPAAFRRKGPKDTSEQQFMFLPPVERGLERDRPVETITPQKISSLAEKHLTEGAPNFKEFVGESQSQFGHVQKGQLRDVWEDAVWKKLMSASGEQLQQLRTELKLGRHFGTRDISDAPQPGMPTNRGREKYRNAVLRGIATKLIGQTEEGRSTLRRSTLSPDDIAWNRPSSFNAFREISADEAANPQMLDRLATDGFRASAQAPETHTRRVLALVNKSTGEVELVSTYLHPRRGAMVVDPKLTGKMRPNVSLASLTKNYRPIATVLLDEPVQNFRQRFDSVGRFNEEFADQARNELQSQASHEASLAEGAGVLGGEEEAPSVIRSGERVTDAEAGKLLDHLMDEHGGSVNGPEDVLQTISELGEKPNWQVIAAYNKMFEAIRERLPELTPQQAVEQLADEIYDYQKTSKTRDEFVSRALKAYHGELPEAGQGTAEALPGKGSNPVELTTPKRRPIKAAQPTELPSGQKQLFGFIERSHPQPYPFEPGPSQPLRLHEGGGVLQQKMEPEVRRRQGKRTYLAKAAGVIYRSPESEATVPARTGVPAAGEGTAENAPGAFMRKARAKAEDEFVRLRDSVSALGARKAAKEDMAKLRDRADNLANTFADQAEKSVRLESARGPQGIREKLAGTVQRGSPEALAAAKALVQSGFDRAKLGNFLNLTQSGITRAEALLSTGSMGERRQARKWLTAAKKLRSEVEYARAHWADPELQATAQAVKDELELQYAREVASGRNLKHDENYLPGRYDAELFDDNSVKFGGRKDILGRQWRAPKTFASYYDAIAAGPYIPATYDAASLVSHRVRQGMQQINKSLWVQSLKNINDPHTGTPAVTNPVKRPDGTFSPPTPEHALVYPIIGQDPVAVRRDFVSTVRNLSGQSAVQDMPVVPHVLELGQKLKHTILLGDFFHLARLSYYAGAIMGPKAGFRGGATALEYRPTDLPRAVSKGLVRPQDAAWASQPVNVRLGARTVPMTRLDIARASMDQGLNVGRIQDALYKDMVSGVPGLGRYNRWLFDRFTRGLMLETAVREFERQNAKHPDVDSRKLMRDIARDTNNFYGSIGRQGWFKNPTLQDMTRLALLAPQWVEGLVKKEAALPGRLTGLSHLAGRRGVDLLGTTGKGIGTGLAAMLALTQAVNIITRGQPTWKNEEEGHKFDAWIPGNGEDSPGAWISPLSIFNELAHDLIRYGESKEKGFDAVAQIGQNKLGPWGRLGMVLATGATGRGEHLTTTGGVLKEGAKAIAPVPISFGRIAQAGGHAVAPGLVPPTSPGAVERQMLGTAGIKAEVAETASQRIAGLADDFLKREGLKKETGYANTPTDEASYSKLRSALRSEDAASAQKLYARLLVGRKPEELLESMRRWKDGNFTGNDKNETLFKWSLDEKQLETYSRAILDRQKIFQKFVEFYLSQ